MFSSVIYYELDQVVISNLIGLEAVAIYAAALSVLQLVRSFNGIVFSPYTSRYNHFVGLNDYDGLTHFVKKMIVLFSTVLIVPILTLSLMAGPFVISWVGEQYMESGILVSFLVLSFIFNFIKDPVNQYLVATEKNRVLVRYSIMTPVLFWVGVFLLITTHNVKAFAIMKFVAPLAMLIAYWLIASKDFKSRGCDFLSLISVLKTVVPTIIIVFFFSWIFSHWMIEEHTKKALCVNILLMGTSVVLSLGLAIPFNTEIRTEVSRYVKSFANRIRKK